MSFILFTLIYINLSFLFKANQFHQQSNYHSPSPNTVLSALNDSGPYMCPSKPISNDFLQRPASSAASTKPQQTHQLQPLNQPKLEASLGQTNSTAINHQMMFSNESNYSSLMRHLYNNDDPNLPNIECGSGLFPGNPSGGKSEENSMSSGRNDCQFPGEQVTICT